VTQERLKLLLLLRAQRGHMLDDKLLLCGHCSLGKLSAFRGEEEQVRPPVIGVGPANYQPAVLQPVDQATHVALGDE
jgi:hypothetical protein